MDSLNLLQNLTQYHDHELSYWYYTCKNIGHSQACGKWKNGLKQSTYIHYQKVKYKF